MADSLLEMEVPKGNRAAKRKGVHQGGVTIKLPVLAKAPETRTNSVPSVTCATAGARRVTEGRRNSIPVRLQTDSRSPDRSPRAAQIDKAIFQNILHVNARLNSTY